MTDITVRFGGAAIRIAYGENTALAGLSAAKAATSEENAAASAATAEAFSGPTFTSVAEGLEKTSDGQEFAVHNDGIVTVYRKVSGAAVWQRDYPTATALRSPDPLKGAALIGLPDNSSVQDAIPRKSRTLKQMGVSYASTADQRAALQRALTIAGEDSINLIAEPHSIYKHDGLLDMSDVIFDGQGAELQALDPDYSRIKMMGARVGLRNLLRTSPNTDARSSTYAAIGVLVQDATDVLLENVEVDGVSNAGILLDNVQRALLWRTKVVGSRADALHITNGSSDIDSYYHLAISPGDDGFAVVTYGGDPLCERIRSFGARVFDSVTRGMTVVGGRDVWYYAPTIARSAAAAIYFASEASKNIYGVRDCGVIGGNYIDCNTSEPSQGVIHLSGRSGSITTPSDEVVANTVENITVYGVKIRGIGAGGRAGVTEAEYCLNNTLIADMKGIRYTGKAPSGFEIGGHNTRIGGRLENIGGAAFIGRPSISGDFRANALSIDGFCLDGPSTNHAFYFNVAANLEYAEVERVHMWKRGAVVPTPINHNNLTAAQKAGIKNNMVDGAKLADPPTLVTASVVDGSITRVTYQVDVERTAYAEAAGGISATESTTVAGPTATRVETMAIIVKPSRAIRFKWMANRQSNYALSADIEISGKYITSAPTGAVGVDYVAAGSGYFQLTTISGALNSGNVAAISLTYDATAQRVTITFTPVNSINARVSLQGVG